MVKHRGGRFGRSTAGSRTRFYRGFEPLEPRLALAAFTDIGLAVENPGDPGGGKAAWGDFDNDGWVDLTGDGIVWHNDGGSFSQFQALTSIGGDGIWGDYDNDGFLDIILGSKLFRNVNGTSFEDVSSLIPPLPHGNSKASVWGDFNGDSYLDLFVGGYAVSNNWPYEADALLINNQGQGFTLAWQESGTILPGRGVTAADFDEDGDLDVYVSNYRRENNYLFENDGQGNITDTAASRGVQADGGHSIGSAWGDLDNDGHIDLFAGNFAHSGQSESRFLRNLGPSGNFAFQDLSDGAGLAYQESFASPSLADYDNDGDLDLYFTTVYSGDLNVLYTNNGSWSFSDVTSAAGLDGLDITYMNAWADIDNDGDLDLATDGRVFRNNETGNNWLKVHLEGDGQQINRSAIGAQVRASFNGMVLTRQVEAGTGEGNQNDLTLHFGLGNYAGNISLDIFWPDGTNETMPVTPNQSITVSYDQPPTVPGPLTASDVQPFQATVSWGASTDPDGDPVSYELQYKKDGVSQPWSELIVTSSASYTLTGLASDTTYWTRVRASDGDNLSDWTDQGANLVMDVNAAFTNSFDGSGNIWTDVTPNGNDAVAQNFAPNLAAHWTGNSKFDMGGVASGRQFTVPSFTNYDDSSGSVEIWIDSHSNTGGSPQNLFSFGDDQRLVINDNQYEWRDGSSVFKGPSNDSGAGPRQLVVTHDGGETKLYLDGVEFNSAANSFWLDNSSNDFRIGAMMSQTGWPGFVHIVRYYDAALTPEEIGQNFVSGLLGTDYHIQEGDPLFTTLPAVSTPDIGEVGQITNLTHVPQMVALNRLYYNPVVFAQSPSSNESQPAVVRVTDVQSNRFTIYLAESSDGDGVHISETVTYIVLEAGRHVLSSGSTLEVGLVDTSKTVGNQLFNSWESVSFTESFAETPVVLSQIQTTNGAALMKTRHLATSSSSLLLGLEPEEITTSQGVQETVGYLAFPAGSGFWSGMPYQAAVTSNSVTHQWYQLSYDTPFQSAPGVLTSLATYDSGDNAHVRYTNSLNTGVQLKVEEETSYDPETVHTTEAVAFLAIAGEGLLTTTFSPAPPTVIAFEQNGPSGLSNILETLSYTFDKEVVITTGDLTLKDLTAGGAAVDLTGIGFHYDSATRQATWDFTSGPAISTGSYEVALSAATIVDVTGNPLDGNADGVGGDDYLHTILLNLSGDYTGDGTVDAADYTHWRDTLGNSVPAFSGADGSGNGTIDQADYAVWRNNFGATLATASSSSATAALTTAKQVTPAPMATPLTRVAATAPSEPSVATSRPLAVYATLPPPVGSQPAAAHQLEVHTAPLPPPDNLLLAFTTSQAPAETSSVHITGSDHGLNTPTSDLATDATDNIPWDVIDDAFTALAATEK